MTDHREKKPPKKKRRRTPTMKTTGLDVQSRPGLPAQRQGREEAINSQKHRREGRGSTAYWLPRERPLKGLKWEPLQKTSTGSSRQGMRTSHLKKEESTESSEAIAKAASIGTQATSKQKERSSRL